MSTLLRVMFAITSLLGIAISLPATAGPPDPYGYAPCCAYEYNWSGLFIGGHAGALHSQLDWTFANPIERVEQSNTSFAGGAQAGLQYQWAQIVAGFEVSYTWADVDITSASAVAPGITLTSNVKNLLLATGRLGYAYERWLAYAKGGYATADVDFRSAGALTTSSSGREHGWTAGLGIDMALTSRISIGVEYDYVRLNVGGRDQSGLAQVSDVGVDLQTFMARLNFRFGRDEPAPVK